MDRECLLVSIEDSGTSKPRSGKKIIFVPERTVGICMGSSSQSLQGVRRKWAAPRPRVDG